MAAVIGPEYCCPAPTTFYVQDNLKSWSGEDVKILDGTGGIAFTVDAKTWSAKQLRVMKDAQAMELEAEMDHLQGRKR